MPLRDVRHLAQMDFTGPDAAAFLQGYLTADLEALAPCRALPMALCNLKGRVIGNGWAAGESTHIRLLVHPSVVPILARELGKYLLFAKSKLNETQAGVRLDAEASPDAFELPPVGHYATLSTADEGHTAFANACADSGFVLVTETISRELPAADDRPHRGRGRELRQGLLPRPGGRRTRRTPGSSETTACVATQYEGEGPAVGADVMAGSRKIGTVVAVGGAVALAAVRSGDSPVRAGGCTMDGLADSRLGRP